MIERYSITATPEQVAERFACEVPGFYKPRYNAAPTQLLPVITSASRKGLSLFYWGKPPEWAKNKALSERLINVQVDHLRERPVLKKLLMKYRCIVLADGFYAWKKWGKRNSIPYRFVTDQALLSFAGLWEEFEDSAGSMVHTFTMITTNANETVGRITDRMPVILDKNAEQVWLNEESAYSELLPLFVEFPADKISLYTVSPRVNTVSTDVPSLIIPSPPADQHGNLTLFD